MYVSTRVQQLHMPARLVLGIGVVECTVLSCRELVGSKTYMHAHAFLIPGARAQKHKAHY